MFCDDDSCSGGQSDSFLFPYVLGLGLALGFVEQGKMSICYQRQTHPHSRNSVRWERRFRFPLANKKLKKRRKEASQPPPFISQRRREQGFRQESRINWNYFPSSLGNKGGYGST